VRSRPTEQPTGYPRVPGLITSTSRRKNAIGLNHSKRPDDDEQLLKALVLRSAPWSYVLSPSLPACVCEHIVLCTIPQTTMALVVATPQYGVLRSAE
jgi:hypothetical protein